MNRRNFIKLLGLAVAIPSVVVRAASQTSLTVSEPRTKSVEGNQIQDLIDQMYKVRQPHQYQWIVCGTSAAEILKKLPEFQPSNTPNTPKMGISYVGEVRDLKLRCFHDTYLPEDELLMGYKSEDNPGAWRQTHPNERWF